MRPERPYFHELDALYRKILGRAIDNSGYFNYASLLECGERSLEQVERELLNSEEYRQRRIHSTS